MTMTTINSTAINTPNTMSSAVAQLGSSLLSSPAGVVEGVTRTGVLVTGPSVTGAAWGSSALGAAGSAVGSARGCSAVGSTGGVGTRAKSDLLVRARVGEMN